MVAGGQAGAGAAGAPSARPVSTDGGEAAIGMPLVPEEGVTTPRRRGFWSRSTRGQQSSGAAALHPAPEARVALHRGSVIDKVKTGNWTKDADLEGQHEEHRAGKVRACASLPARRRAVKCRAPREARALLEVSGGTGRNGLACGLDTPLRITTRQACALQPRSVLALMCPVSSIHLTCRGKSAHAGWYLCDIPSGVPHVF